MSITSGLTTLEEWSHFCSLSARTRDPEHRGEPSFAASFADLELTPLLCAINALPLSLRKAASQALNGYKIIHYWHGSALAAAQRSADREGTRIGRAGCACCQPEWLARATKLHNSLILLDCRLSSRRLECKRNFRQKCPQNRLRPGNQALGAPDRRGSSFNSMSFSNINLTPIGVLPWSIHATPRRITCWRLLH